MNIFSATGNLGKDCRVNQTTNSTVCGFTLAVKSGFGSNEQTLWLDCSMWGKLAEGSLPDYLTKGQQVAVTGELGQREHEGKTYLTLRVTSIDLIGKREDNPPQPAQNAPQPAQNAPQNMADPSLDDDLPF